MAFSHGKNTFISIEDGTGSSGTVRNISSYCDNVSHPFTVEQADVTTYGRGHKAYLAGLRDTSVSIGGNWDPTLDDWMAGSAGVLAYPESRTMIVGPAGNTATYVSYTFEVVMTSWNVSMPVGDKVSFTAEFVVADTPVRGTFT